MAFSWIDIRKLRSSESRAFAILNDRERDVSRNVLDARRRYDMHPTAWSARGEVKRRVGSMTRLFGSEIMVGRACARQGCPDRSDSPGYPLALVSQTAVNEPGA